MLHVALGRRGRRKPGPGQAGAVLLVVGLVLLLAGAWLGHEAESILGHLGTARGKVLTIELAREKRGKTPRATVEFEAEGSTVFLLHQRVGAATREGDPVDVIYDRRDPAGHASLRRPEDLRGPYLAFLAVGGILAAVAAAFLVVALRSRGGLATQAR